VKVLVDTSVWSLALRRKVICREPKVEVLAELISTGQSIYLTGIILQELLQGIKDSAQFANLENKLLAFPLLEPDRDTYKQAARLFSKCRSGGTPVATVDCLIAAVAIANDCRLLSRDADFEKLATVSKLRLL
jgi:predicted nucleic acid-binding protein